MVIKYCTHCAGRPYTDNMQLQACPKCGKALGIESVDEATLDDRPTLDVPAADDYEDSSQSGDWEEKNSDPFSQDPAPWTPSNPVPQDSGHVPATPRSGTPFAGSRRSAGVGAGVIRGKVFQYSSTGKEDGRYRRFPWTKLIDAIVYKQRFEDVLHRFYVRVEGEKDAFGNVTYRDVPVNVHGTIAGGMQITDNCVVEVEGKFRNGVLMADRIYLMNDGFRSQIKFQHSPTAILHGVFAIAALIFLIAIGLSSDGAFFENIGAFLQTWLITAVIVTVLYLVLLFTRAGLLAQLIFGKQRGFPLLGIALISLLLALIFTNSFGIGSAVGSVFSGALGAVLPIIIFIIFIVVLFKMFF